MSTPEISPLWNTAIAAYDLPIPAYSPFRAGPCSVCGKELPPYTPLRNTVPDPHGACHAKLQADREARVAGELAAAVTEWEQARQQHTDSPVVLAVLDLHQPEDADNAHYYIGCRECEESDGLESTRPEHWPCNTYTTMRDATPRLVR